MRHLLRVPSSYTVIWQQGGAHGQFAAVPLNLLGAKVQADYVDSGVWARRAMRQGLRGCPEQRRGPRPGSSARCASARRPGSGRAAWRCRP